MLKLYFAHLCDLHPHDKEIKCNVRPCPHAAKRTSPPPFYLAAFQEYLRPNGSISIDLNTTQHATSYSRPLRGAVSVHQITKNGEEEVLMRRRGENYFYSL